MLTTKYTQTILIATVIVIVSALLLPVQSVRADGPPNFIMKWGRNGGDGTSGLRDGEFSSPHGVAVDNNGNIYVADEANHRIQKFDSNGAFLIKWGRNGGDGTSGLGNGEFNFPYDLAADKNTGNIYVGDSWNHRVQKFNSNGTFLLKWGRNGGDGSSGSGDGEFYSSPSTAVDSNGNVYVVDSWNHRIQKFDSNGNFLAKWGRNGGDGTSGSGDGEFNYPTGVTIDNTGNVYIADRYNHRIQKFSSNGNFLAKWGRNGGDGTSGSGDGEFNLPAGVEVDDKGNVYVADTNNHRIQKFSSNGNFLAKWGRNGGDGTSGSGDGEFKNPTGVAVDSNRNIYVADTDNHRIQKFSFEANIGFKPNPDGYRFSNYGGYNFDDYTMDDIRRMFGDDAVCQMSGGTCIPKPTARQWNRYANLTMNGGHCDGMASTSLRFFKGLDNPSSFQVGVNTTHELQLSNARRYIAYYFVEQLTDPVASYKNQVRYNTPSEILAQLRVAMFGSAPDPTTLFVRQAGQGGHAITPYAIEDNGDGVYWIRVYDNNHADDASRYVTINTNNNTWNYNLGGIIWSGDANTHSLGIVPISKYGEQPVCPWCGSSTISSASDNSIGQVWLTGKGHLLFTDTQGRRIGYDGNQFVNEIPGAYENHIDGGLGVGIEPIYSLPLTETYTILLDGQTLTQTEVVSVAHFGPGYATSVESINLDSTSQDRIYVATDGTQLAYEPNKDKEASLTLALDKNDTSNQFQFINADIGATQSVTATVNFSNTQLTFDNSQTDGGTYDLGIVQVSAAGQQIFVHANVVISTTDTHYINYGTLDSTDTVTLIIDHSSNGTMDETVILENQNKRSTYLPIILK